MPTRPSQDFTWTGTPVDPGGAKKAAGFAVAERVPASWLDYLFGLIAQWFAFVADIVDVSYEIPVNLAERKVEDGTWTIGTYNTLTESTSARECVVPVRAPVGCVITEMRLRGSQVGATDTFYVDLIRVAGASTITSISAGVAVSNNGITGSEQDIEDTAINHTVLPNERYFLRIGTLGGGAGARSIIGAWVSVKHG